MDNLSSTSHATNIPPVQGPWYAVWNKRYVGNQPQFYDPTDLPWAQVIEANWEIMRDELLALLSERPERLRPYSINHSMSFPPKHWKTMGLYFWKVKMHSNCRACPKTMAIIDGIPGLTSFSLSILEPGANINPHQGDTDAVIRCHVGLIIPGGLPELGFQVGDQIRPWEEGKMLPFCDAQTHTAWNQTNERRYILILDVVRPELLHRTNEICAHVLASAVLQMISPKIGLFQRGSGWLRWTVYHLARIGIRVALPFQRRWG